MSFNFPNGAAVGQEYVTGAGITYVYNGYGWAVKAAINEAPVDGKIYGRKDASWAEVVADVNRSYVDTQDNLRVAKAGDIMTGELKLRQGNVGTIRFGADDGPYFHYNGTDFYTSRRLVVGGDSHAGYAARAGTFRFGDINTDRYVTHDGTNTHWNVGGTMYMNVPLANVHSITSGNINASGAIIYTSGATMQGRSYAYIGWQDNSTPALTLYSGDPGWDCFMAFHRLNFACFFGLRTDGYLAWGGWSHGNSSWRLWSERDGGWPISNCYLPYAGDVYHGSEAGVTQPYGGAVAAGAYSYGGGLRYRYLQVYTNSWWTVGYG